MPRSMCRRTLLKVSWDISRHQGTRSKKCGGHMTHKTFYFDSYMALVKKSKMVGGGHFWATFKSGQKVSIFWLQVAVETFPCILRPRSKYLKASSSCVLSAETNEKVIWHVEMKLETQTRPLQFFWKSQANWLEYKFVSHSKKIFGIWTKNFRPSYDTFYVSENTFESILHLQPSRDTLEKV